MNSGICGRKGTNDRPSVLCIVGPTGSGKSELALRLAVSLNGEIVNCDSLQLYRGFDIGTAKPTATEQSMVPHHLLDVAGPADDYTAGAYARHALPVLHSISDRGKLPLVAGGTGFYLKSLTDGLVSSPTRDADLRKRLQMVEMRHPGRLHRMLRRWDATSAARVQAGDVQKLIRALELMILERQPLSAIYQKPREGPGSLSFFQIGLDPPRDLLYRRLDARCDRMWQGGLLDEAQQLLAAGCSPSSKPFGAIGYKQALRVLNGTLNAGCALEEMKRDTRRYAKRQWTWFRRDRRVFWVKPDENAECTHDKVVRLLYKRYFWY